MAERIETAEQAREEMLRWANRESSHWDLILDAYGPERRGEVFAAVAQADAAEVEKWAAVYRALTSEPE